MTLASAPARLSAAAAVLGATVVTAVVALVLAPTAAAGRGTRPVLAPRLAVYPFAVRAATGGRHAHRAVAYVRGAHLSPDTAAVDVYLTGFAGGRTTLWLSDVGYGDVSGYRRIPAGTYVVSMRPHGAAKTSAPVMSWTIALAGGHSYTAAAIGDGRALHGVVLNDSPPPAGSGRGSVRVIQAADRAGVVTVRLDGGSALTNGLRFGRTSAYSAVVAGRHTVAATGRHAVAKAGEATRARTVVTIAPHSATSLEVLDARGGGITVRPLTDTAAPMHVPNGPVDAGGGGTAGRAAAGPAAQPTGGAPTASEPPGAVPAGARNEQPVALRIPAIGVRTALEPLGLLADGTMQPPSRWQTAGWYADGVVPGRPGPAVIVGHVDSISGPAVFYRLRRLRAGERAIVQTASGDRRVFVIDSLRRYRKARFPSRAVYGPTPDAQLRLITCTGRFDRAADSYVDNLVVAAHLVRDKAAVRRRPA